MRRKAALLTSTCQRALWRALRHLLDCGTLEDPDHVQPVEDMKQPDIILLHVHHVLVS